MLSNAGQSTIVQTSGQFRSKDLRLRLCREVYESVRIYNFNGERLLLIHAAEGEADALKIKKKLDADSQQSAQ